MADTIKDFLVSLGFQGDAAGAKKVVDLQKSTEAAITKAAEDGADKRVEAEQQASAERIGIISALGKIFLSMEEDRAKKSEKIKKDEAARDEKLQQEREKKAAERRAKAVKDLQAHATKMAAFALKTVGAVEAAALGVVYATDRAAKGFERLNYASQRAGTTPGKMTAYGYAISQVGGTAEEGNAMVASLGRAMKFNAPGMESVFKTLGIQARNAKGELKDTVALAEDLGEALARKRKEGTYGYAQALNYGATAGWSEDDVQNAIDPRVRRLTSERQAIDAKTGADQGAAAEGGTKFEQSMRKLDAVLESIRTKVETTLFVKLQPQLDKLSTWGEQHGGQVADVIGRIADDLLKLATAVIDNLAKVDWDSVLTKIEKFGQDFDKKSREIFGENGPIIATLAAFGALIGAKVLGPLNLVLDALKLIGGVPLVGRLLGGAATTAATAAASVPGVVAGTVLAGGAIAGEMKSPMVDEFGRVTGNWGGDPDHPYGQDPNAPGTKPSVTFGTMWDWLKGKVGFGSGDPDAKRVKDAILQTAEGVKKLADNANGVDSGVTASSGGVGGSGQHFGGGPSAGATLGDRAHGRRGTGRGSASGPQSDVNAPGANGYGTIDAPYRAGVDAKGEGGHLSPRELFDYLKARGATDNEATMLTGAAGNESSFNPNAVHDGGRGHGLWGHNDGRIDMRGRNWQQQADAALAEAKRDYAGRINAARTPQELADAEMHYERPRGYRPNNPRGGDNYTGRLHTIDRFGKIFGTLGSTSGGSAVSQAGGSTSESVGERIAGMRAAGLLTDEQCVTLAMAAVGVRKGSGEAGANVHDWRKGDAADAGTLKPGTPVATFLDRQGRETDRYAGGGAGTPGAHLDHAGVFQKYVLDAYGKRIGMTIAEQYKGSRGIHLKDYLFGKGWGEGNGSNYHAVLGPDGRPLGAGRNSMGAGQPVKVEVTPQSAERIGHGIVRGAARNALSHRNDSLAATQAVLRAHSGHLIPGLNPHSSLARSIRHQIDNSRRHVAMTHNPTYHINGGDPQTMLADAHRHAGRGQADLVRNMSVMTA